MAFLDLRLDRLKVETRALLHRRVLNRALGPGDFLLHKTPELKSKSIVERQRTVGTVGKVHAFKRIKRNIGQSMPIDLDRATKPAARLR
jgi:hypothetical protein